MEDGFAAAIETPGEHALTLDLEVPVTSRGAKPELGFEIGLPRAAITTLLLEPPDPAIKRVNLTTRTSDPTQPMRPPEPRRVPALDVKQFASRPGQETGYALGPVELVEVTWEPPGLIGVAGRPGAIGGARSGRAPHGRRCGDDSADQTARSRAGVEGGCPRDCHSQRQPRVLG